MKTKTSKAPAHLSKESARIWQAIVTDYEIDLAAEWILTAALEARDRRAQALESIAKDGAVFADRFGQLKPSPWLAVERDAAAVMMRGWRLLGFDQEPRGELGVPQK